jgi:hypothetical protein
MRKYLPNSSNKPLALATLLAALLSAAVSCQPGAPSSEPAARFGDAVLSRADLGRLLPDSLRGEDSARLARQTIESWMGRQALAQEAMKKDPALAAEIAPLVEAYRLTLLEEALAGQESEASAQQLEVPEEEIRAYYARHPEKFVSNAPYYQYFYVKTALPYQYKVVNLIRSDNPEQIRELLAWAQENAREYKLDSSFVDDAEITRISNGFYFGNIRTASPSTPYPYAHQEGDTMFYDFFRMIRVIKPGETMPLQMCRQPIAQSLRNRRQQEAMEQLRARLVEQAKAAKTAVIY